MLSFPLHECNGRESWASGPPGLAWENKVAKGFNTTDVPLEFCLLLGEVAEAFDAWRKDRGTVGEELADVAVFLFSPAAMTGAEAKIEKNAARASSGSRTASLRRMPAKGTGPSGNTVAVVSAVMTGAACASRAKAAWKASVMTQMRSTGGLSCGGTAAGRRWTRGSR